MTTIRPRFSAAGGEIVDCFGRPVPLARAISLSEEWMRSAQLAQDRGEDAIAKVYARDALALELPASVALQWRVAAGFPNPLEEPEDQAGRS